MAATYKYDPYGRTLSSSGTLASANVYRFSSKEIHPNSGFYCYGFRFYDPNTQRWPSRDPIGEAGGFNLYRFANNNPISQFDPFGHKPKPTPPPGMDYDPNCYAKCGKQNLIELGLCTGLLAGTTAFCIWQPAICLAQLDKLLALQYACFAAAEAHYAACLASCLITKKCPYPLGPYPGGPFDFP
jgi:RHS repeat-associated protein